MSIKCISANLILVALSFDRVIALWLPVYYFQNARESIAVITSISIHVVIALLLLPIWSWFEVHDNTCSFVNFDLMNEQLSLLTSQVYNFGLSVTVPVVCLVTCNTLVIYKLRNRMSVMSQRDREISVSLVLVSTAFTILLAATFLTVHFQHNSTTVEASTKDLFGHIKVKFLNFYLRKCIISHSGQIFLLSERQWEKFLWKIFLWKSHF